MAVGYPSGVSGSRDGSGVPQGGFVAPGMAHPPPVALDVQCCKGTPSPVCAEPILGALGLNWGCPPKCCPWQRSSPGCHRLGFPALSPFGQRHLISCEGPGAFIRAELLQSYSWLFLSAFTDTNKRLWFASIRGKACCNSLFPGDLGQ
ncbi:hypothetical protein DV515_00008760, partial [Chloebia gouldiae]